MQQPCLYILASQRNGTLYIGITSHLAQRIWQHKNGTHDGFTREYKVHHLIYVEFHATMVDAIQREKRIKKWRRVWKLALIERDNPDWLDLYDRLNV